MSATARVPGRGLADGSTLGHVSAVKIVMACAGGLCSFVGAFRVLRWGARTRRAIFWEEVRRTIRNPASVELRLSPAMARSSASIGAWPRDTGTRSPPSCRRVGQSLCVAREQFAYLVFLLVSPSQACFAAVRPR
jgi:hypothetical protein